MAKSNEKIHWSTDFDGDGVVFGAEIVTYPTSPAVYLRLTFNSGNHKTIVGLDPEDLGNFSHMIEMAQKQAVVALVAVSKPRVTPTL